VIPHACDQIASDLFVAAGETREKYGILCRLDISVGERLIEAVERLDRRPYAISDIIDLVLNVQSLSSVEREGYRLALKKIFGRRKGAARDERRRRDAATDFPRGQEW
jgi:hypothetical protein